MAYLSLRLVTRLLVAAPVLVACAGTADAKPRPRLAAAPPDVARGEAIALAAKKLDALAAEEEPAARFTKKIASDRRARATALRKEASASDDDRRAALLAKAEAAELDGDAADARVRVYAARAKAIRARASEVRRLAKKVLRGEAAAPLAAVTLPPPPASHPNHAAPRTLPAVSPTGALASTISPFAAVE